MQLCGCALFWLAAGHLRHHVLCARRPARSREAGRAAAATRPAGAASLAAARSARTTGFCSTASCACCACWARCPQKPAQRSGPPWRRRWRLSATLSSASACLERFLLSGATVHAQRCSLLLRMPLRACPHGVSRGPRTCSLCVLAGRSRTIWRGCGAQTPGWSSASRTARWWRRSRAAGAGASTAPTAATGG